ncbi:hypothetical protein Talka_00417 [Tepidimonas alkaliphilus]|uniref:TubC N-terminal docking domain-containing protein n=1 Tax=Tepidimonas alkaliphilus TaxID=2588942 RepID=A0A554WAY8_9BURK|nr:hypothetical protein [Tepidimonas alkaliphilus]TSE20754.1 hypothetical protein Talka_00417 [Tepidimonas alkaliphilus]
MTARELLTRCAAAGITLAAEAGRLRVAGPAEAVRELTPLLREHRDELLVLLAGSSAAPALTGGAPDPGVPADRTCAACAHRTSAGTCARPVEAGLAAHFAIRWPPAGHAAVCKAFERQQLAAHGSGTQTHPFETARRNWTPATAKELAAMEQRHRRAVVLGLDPQQADLASDVLHWRDRTGDDRRLCLECRSLRVGTTSRWHCAALHLPLAQQLVTQPHRCETFQDLQEERHGD